MINYEIVHKTFYTYTIPVTLGHNEVHLKLPNLPHQTINRSELNINPYTDVMFDRFDIFGNPVTYFAVQNPHDFLEVSAIHEVQINPLIASNLEESNSWEDARHEIGSSVEPESYLQRSYILDSPYVKKSQELFDYALPSFPSGRPLLLAISDLIQRIYTDFEYVPGSTSIKTPISNVLNTKRGVCQDFAHLSIGCLRSLDIPARYVSGYIETKSSEEKNQLLGSDASHAWISVYSPDGGWVDFDPTNNKIPYDQHITLSWGRDYSDITPLKGVILGGALGNMEVFVNVRQL